MIDNLTEATRLLKATQLMLLGKDNQPISDLYYALQTAVDSIEELQERREADRWISIKERIPAKTGRYLVTYSNGEVDACFYSYEFISGKYEVTHWKPLPQNPEESEDK